MHDAEIVKDEEYWQPSFKKSHQPWRLVPNRQKKKKADEENEHGWIIPWNELTPEERSETVI